MATGGVSAMKSRSSNQPVIVYVGSNKVLAGHLGAICYGQACEFRILANLTQLTTWRSPPAPMLFILDRETSNGDGDAIHRWSEKLGPNSEVILFASAMIPQELEAKFFSPHLNKLLMVSQSVESLEKVTAEFLHRVRADVGALA